MLVTGASGFIGRAVCERLSAEPGLQLVASARPGRDAGLEIPVVGRELAPGTEWHDLLETVDVVVHCAARVHLGDRISLADYRRVNVAGTINLARQAADAGIRRFIFLSSAKVLGDNTAPGRAFSVVDRAAPRDAYGRSKHEAEVGLAQLGRERGMEVVILRPPLVYGPGVKANFLQLMRWIQKGYPLPFGSVRNRRSLVAVQNLVELIRICCTHPRAADRTFMAADGEDVSTAELARRIGAALDRPARLVPVSPRLLLALAVVVGKRNQAMKLLGSLQVDARETRELLGWQPVASLQQALELTARDFLEKSR